MDLLGASAHPQHVFKRTFRKYDRGSLSCLTPCFPCSCTFSFHLFVLMGTKIELRGLEKGMRLLHCHPEDNKEYWEKPSPLTNLEITPASPSQFHQGSSDLLFSACKHEAGPVQCPVPGRYLQGRAEYAARRMGSGSFDRELRWWPGNRSWQGQRQAAAWVGSGKELVSELLGRGDFSCCLSPTSCSTAPLL